MGQQSDKWRCIECNSALESFSVEGRELYGCIGLDCNRIYEVVDGAIFQVFWGDLNEVLCWSMTLHDNEGDFLMVPDMTPDGYRGNWVHVEQVGALEEKLREARRWVDDLQSGMYINCVYCGWRAGENKPEGVPADVLKKHIQECPEHPLSKLRAKYRVQGQRLARVAHEYEVLRDASQLQQLERVKAQLSEEISVVDRAREKSGAGLGDRTSRKVEACEKIDEAIALLSK